jgi:LPXTG-motif cell wall anchor domain protein
MLESNTQGHGTIKKLRTGAVISTLAISALGVSTTVSASETEVAVNEPATKVVAKDEVKSKVPTQSDVDKAKAESDKASQNVAKQKAVVAEKQTQLQDTEKTVTELKEKVKEANSVTPEKVADAKADADSTAKAVTSAVESVQSAEKSVSATSEKVANQTKVVSNAEKTATATANKVVDAQKKVDSLSSLTDTTKLEKDVYILSAKVDVDTRGVKTAQEKLDNGKKALANKEEALKEAQQKVESAEATLKEKATVLDNAKSVRTQKEEVVKSAKADLERAKEELTDATEGNYTVNLSSEYVSLLKEYFANPSQELSNKLKALAFKEYEKFGKITFDKNGEVYRYDLVYPKESKKDLATKVDINNLDYSTRKELSLFAADLINQIRKQFGTKDVVVTEDSIRIANEVARKSTEEYGHDFKALSEVEKENGVLLGELAGFSDDPATTLADIKKRIYDDILSMLFNDAHAQWGHATSLSGVVPKDPNEGYMQYTGLGFRSNATFTSVIQYSKISDNMVSANAKFDKTKVIPIPSLSEKIAKLQDKVNLAQETYVSAYRDCEDANSKEILANSRYNDANDVLYFARKVLSDVKMGNIDLEVLETRLAEAKDKLAKDTKALQTAKEVFAIAQSNAVDQAKALKQAKESQKTAKSEKATADETLATAKSELEVLTKAHTVAEMALTKANKELEVARTESKEATKKFNLLNSALMNKETVLKDLNTKLIAANAKVATIRAELETAQEELTRLEGIAEAKARILANLKQLKADHDAYLAEQQRLQALKDKEDAIRKAGGQPKEVIDPSGKVVDIVDAKAQNKPVNVATVGTKDDKTYQALTQATNAKAEPKKQLPNTGTKESMFGLLGLSLLVGLGLGYKGKHRRG